MRGTIRVAGLGKRYRLAGEHRSGSILAKLRFVLQRSPAEFVWGLRNVTFSVAPGRAVGVIGRNGAGKSSLLRLIGGVGKPDEGTIELHGRMGAVLDIGAGLTDDLTGRENLMLAGLISGMSRADVRQRAERIVSFAELEDVIDHPLRTYSTGMKMRLAFSVAIHVDPDILLIDEVLAVGDAAFQRKCLARIGEIKGSGCTIFFVSHDASLVRSLCDDVLYLRKGEVVAFGQTQEVMAIYDAFSQEGAREHEGCTPDTALSDGHVLQAGFNRFGSFEAEIRNVRLLDPEGRPVRGMLSGSGLVVEFEYHAEVPVGEVIASVTIKHPDGNSCFDTNTSLAGITLTTARPGKLRLAIDRLDLASGEYVVIVALYEPDWAYAYDYHANVYPLTIIGQGTSTEVLDPPLSWETADPPPRAETNSAAVALR
jgi:lipopolysaccharide transport system ATP-binding protein